MLVKKTLQYSYPQVDTTQFYARSGEEFQQPSTLPYSLGQLVCGWFKCTTERLAGSSATKPRLVLCLPGSIFEPQAWKAKMVSGNSESPRWFKNHEIETGKYWRKTLFLKLLWKPFLVHEVTVKQRILEKKENQNYMDSIVLPINCSTNLGNQSYFGQRWNTCCMHS